METKTEPITDKDLIAKLAILWDGKASYVLDGGRQYRVILDDDGDPLFFTDATDAAAEKAQDVQDKKDAAKEKRDIKKANKK